MFDYAYFDQIYFDGVRGESVTVTPSPVEAIASVVAPSVVHGSISITPTPASAIGQVIAPTVVINPTAITQPATNIGGSVARLNGKITDDGGGSCEARFRYRKTSGAVTASTPDTTTHDHAIRLPAQHGAFYAASRYWLFYDDGSNFVFRSSTDGENWSSSSIIAAIAWKGASIDAIFDGTYVHIVWNDNVYFSKYRGLYYRRGVPQSDGTISWSAATQTVLSSSTYCEDVCLIVDSGGYPWAGYAGGIGRYPTIIKSDANDGTWSTASGFPHQFFAYPGWFVLPIAQTSQKVYCLVFKQFGSEETIRGYAWTGSWGSQEVVTSSLLSNGVGGGYFGMLSAVAISDDVHLAFMADNDDIKYVKRSGGSWGSESTIEGVTCDVHSSPVLTRRTNNDLICYWLHNDDKAYFKEQVSGVWDSSPTALVDETTDGFTTEYDLQAYYEELSGNVVLVYQTKSSSPYDIRHVIGVGAGTWTETAWQNSLVTNDTYYKDISGLDAEEEYEFQTQAKNASGEGEWSASDTFETVISVTPTPASAICSVVAPTVIGGAVVVTPNPVSAIAQVVQPTVKKGNIIFSPTPVDAIAKAVNPTVVYGVIIPTPVSAIASVVAPTVVLGSVSITPTYIEAVCQVAGPTVVAGGDVVVAPEFVVAIGGVVAPTIMLGSITITPTEISAIATVVAPNVRQGNIIFSPEYAKAVCQVVVPTVYGGAVILTPVAVATIAKGVNPTVIRGSITITPTFIKALAGVIAPAVLKTWIGRKLKIKVVTSQYRNLNLITCQKRGINIVTTQKRKIKTLTSGG